MSSLYSLLNIRNIVAGPGSIEQIVNIVNGYKAKKCSDYYRSRGLELWVGRKAKKHYWKKLVLMFTLSMTLRRSRL